MYNVKGLGEKGLASTLNVTKALQNPGQEFPFEADCMIDEMEVLGDPVLFTDAKASGLIVGANQNLSVTGEATARISTSLRLRPLT